MSLDQRIRDGLGTLVEPVDIGEVLSEVEARSVRRSGRSWPIFGAIAASIVVLAALGISQLGEDAARQLSAGPAPVDAGRPTTDGLAVEADQEPSVADTPIAELPPSARSGAPSITELDYGDGVLRLPRPEVDGLAEPRLFSMDPSAVAPGATVRWDLPTELAGAFSGSVVVTVLPSDFIDASGGEGTTGIGRAGSMIASAGFEMRERRIAGQPALFVATVDVAPGGSLGLPDRVSSLLTWTQADGSVVQLTSDLMTEVELTAYAGQIIEQAS